MQTRSQKIVRLLPEVRRYAHALMGSTRGGDAQLRIMLETLLQNPRELNARRDLRRELFRFFHTIVHTLQLPLDSSGPDAVLPERRLRDAVAALTLRRREALLLNSLARFEPAQIAEILGITVKGVRHELAAARDHVRRRLSARILIVEDKAGAAARLEHVVEDMGHDVIGVAPSEKEALELARAKRPELVVADVHGQDQATVEAHIRSAVSAPVVSLGRPQPRRRAQGRTTAHGRPGRRRVTAHEVGDAITDALSTPAVLIASALARS